ncbi:ArsR/SmtB family transcription factor [Luteipulveratus flavus]|uniref:Helix-turn-helix domain-containing protein n=1 Tax=Luteipulveratus flavus TaxID=3031728 RepID=A0ABT6CGB2_9MICO|nr:helix-turn-helix domain-containing protein [Luteipulveratus sp. YIM 133296]MDF8266336.1 helix-turn-helix domain-containing protein [Luteipulveratus sp. YIM 133296]
MSLGDDEDRIGELRAVAHPVRLQMLSLLTGAAMSAAEVARELDITQANASYHVRVLARNGLLREAGTESVRGGVAKKYRYVGEERRSGRHVSEEDQALQVEAYAQELRRRLADRRTGSRGMFTDAEMWVTPEVWKKVEALVHEATVLVHEEAQPPRTDGTVKVNMQAFLFEMNDGREADR